MKKLIKYHLIAFAVGFGVTLLMDGLTFHPDAKTAEQRRAEGELQISFIYL